MYIYCNLKLTGSTDASCHHLVNRWRNCSAEVRNCLFQFFFRLLCFSYDDKLHAFQRLWTVSCGADRATGCRGHHLWQHSYTFYILVLFPEDQKQGKKSVIKQVWYELHMFKSRLFIINARSTLNLCYSRVKVHTHFSKQNSRLFQILSMPQKQFFKALRMRNPASKKTTLLLFYTLINADKHHQVNFICHIVIFKAFPGPFTKSKYFPGHEIIKKNQEHSRNSKPHTNPAEVLSVLCFRLEFKHILVNTWKPPFLLFCEPPNSVLMSGVYYMGYTGVYYKVATRNRAWDVKTSYVPVKSEVRKLEKSPNKKNLASLCLIKDKI